LAPSIEDGSLRILRYEKVPSTMDVAEELAEKGEPEWTVVVAEEQTMGRGRHGRRWESPRGGLWLSVILRPPLHVLPILSITAALALCDALSLLYDIDARLKWPNDVLISGYKVAGILVKGVSGAYSIVGVGVNVNNDPPRGIKATSLKAVVGRELDLDELLKTYLEAFKHRYEQAIDNPEKLLKDYKEKLDTIGKRVRALLVTGDVIKGIAVDVTEAGALVIYTDGKLVEVIAGEVEYLR